MPLKCTKSFDAGFQVAPSLSLRRIGPLLSLFATAQMVFGFL